MIGAMPTIVYPPTIDYEWMYQRPQQLLKEIAALGYKVLFYNNERRYKQKNDVIELHPNFFLCGPKVPLGKIQTDKPLILWISYPPHVKNIWKYTPQVVVFDAIDEASGEFRSWARGLNSISNKADIIFTTSEKLYNFHTQRHKNVHMCANGVDNEHFCRAREIFSPKPADLPKNDRPIIGYFGAIAPWIDWDLIRYISYKNKDFNFVMIGPLYGNFKNIVEGKNIYYLGRKEYVKLPEYLQYFDVCIIPFKVTSMIEACNPIKMYEYLSAGKPVVATNMPEARKLDVIDIGVDKYAFNQKLQKALMEKDNADKINARIEVARNNSWAHRAATAVKAIEDVIRRKVCK